MRVRAYFSAQLAVYRWCSDSPQPARGDGGAVTFILPAGYRRKTPTAAQPVNSGIFLYGMTSDTGDGSQFPHTRTFDCVKYLPSAQSGEVERRIEMYREAYDVD